MRPGSVPAFRALIRSARSSVFIAQQDLHGLCNPPAPALTPNFDQPLLDVIAGRLLAGVDVRVVISTPGAALNAQETYSNSTSLSHLRCRCSPARECWPARRHGPGGRSAATSSCGRSGSAHRASGPMPRPGPFWLSEYSLLVENRSVARTFKLQYADRLWIHSSGGRPLPGRPCA